MSKEARQRAHELFERRNDPDFETQIANALIAYGNHRIHQAAHGWHSVQDPLYGEQGPKNLAALVMDVTEQITRDFECVLHNMQEQPVK